MKRLIALVIFIATLGLAQAQSAQGRYSSFRTKDGMLFFIHPQKLKDISGIKRFEYDMTLLSWTDSVTVNFSFESSSLDPVTDLELTTASGTTPCDCFSPLFVDAKKHHYEIRITSRFSFAEIKKIFASETPPRFSFRQGNLNESATYTPKAWTTDKKRLNDILTLFLLSK